jgi:glycolate oxidase iron-sulfur subunit
MSAHDSLRTLDYAVLQQCMHCGMCLPTCPTYDATRLERNSPRGRIALMRAIADGKLDPSRAFADEMYFCLGCLACESACPAGLYSAPLFETARAEAEHSHTLDDPRRTVLRRVLLRGLFMRPKLLRLVGRLLRFYQASGLQTLFRTMRLPQLLPGNLRHLETQTPTAQKAFSCDLIRPVERPAGNILYRVGMLTGCVQDIVLPEVNRDTVDVLLANGCEVHTPAVQSCCGSLHAHNGDPDAARVLARRQLDTFNVSGLEAIITNAAGCGSHLKTYGRLLADDPVYAGRAAEWSRKLRDVNEWLVEIGWRRPRATADVPVFKATYHEACHLCHGQKITRQPREILRGIPGLELVELPESTWCCGSAGVYNITQPEMAARLQARKLGHIFATGAEIAVTANPGCHLQLLDGAARAGRKLTVLYPVTLLARAYRDENAHTHGRPFPS